MKFETGLSQTPWKISDEKAEKELEQFHRLAWILAVVTFFIFGFAAIMAVGVGIRSIILSWRKVNAAKPNGTKLKVSSILATTLALFNTIFYAIQTH